MIIGHERSVRYLERMLSRGTLPHAFLFHGPAHVGKRVLALHLARALLCERGTDKLGSPECEKEECESCRLTREGIHPDLIFLSPENDSEIGIDDARAIGERLAHTAWRGGRKAVVIDNAQRLTHAAQSALLKTLEEPRPETVFVLVTDALDAVLPTIVSRTISLSFPLARDSVLEPLLANFSSRQKKDMLLLARGRPGIVFQLLGNRKFPGSSASGFSNSEEISKDRALFQEWITGLLWTGRDILHERIRSGRKSGLPSCLGFLRDRARDLILADISGLNRRLMVDHIRFNVSRFANDHGTRS